MGLEIILRFLKKHPKIIKHQKIAGLHLRLEGFSATPQRSSWLCYKSSPMFVAVKFSKRKPMKSCTSIFGDPKKWPWDLVRPATCTPVSNGWVEVEKKHPGINSSNEIFGGMTLKQLGLHCHTITTTAPQEKHININTCEWQILQPGIIRQILLLEGFMDRPQDFANGSQPTFWPSILKNPSSLESLEMWKRCMFDVLDCDVAKGEYLLNWRVWIPLLFCHGWVEMLGIQPGNYQEKLLQRLISDKHQHTWTCWNQWKNTQRIHNY